MVYTGLSCTQKFTIWKYGNAYHNTDLIDSIPTQTHTRSLVGQHGRHQEEDAGHEGGEGQRHGPGRRLRAGRQGRQDQERWAGLGNFLIALHGELGYWKLNTVKDLYKIWKHHQM